jgi:hypothetical protein
MQLRLSLMLPVVIPTALLKMMRITGPENLHFLAFTFSLRRAWKISIPRLKSKLMPC